MAAQDAKKAPEYLNPVIGKRYSIDGQRVICKEQTDRQCCKNCAFSSGCHYAGRCNRLSRSDGKNVYFELIGGAKAEVVECPQCGVTFEKVNKWQTYCSNACYMAASDSRRRAARLTTVVCAVCGGQFQGFPSRKYCSEGCAAVGKKNVMRKYYADHRGPSKPRVKHGPVTVVMKVCEKCGKEYKAASYSQKYCHDCRVSEINSTVRLSERKCEVCGKVFLPHRRTTTTCSPNCYATKFYREHRDSIAKRKKERAAKNPPKKRVRTKPGVCKVCGAPTEGGRTVCSGACRGILILRGRKAVGDLRKKRECTCAVCGKEFEGVVGSKYCDSCRKTVKYRYQPVERTRKVCLQCGREFEGLRVQKYCSERCMVAAHPRRIRTLELPESMICAQCGGSFKPNRAVQKYCSPKCQRAAANGKAKAARAGRKLQVYLVNSSDSENLTQKPVIITE